MLAKSEAAIFQTLRMTSSPDYYDQHEDDVTGQLAQGRFIVHARGMRDHIFHEVQIDY